MKKTLTLKTIYKKIPLLVDKYPGKYAIFAGGEVFVGKDAKKLEKEAQKKYPKITPIGMPIPSKQDFTCAL